MFELLTTIYRDAEYVLKNKPALTVCVLLIILGAFSGGLWLSPSDNYDKIVEIHNKVYDIDKRLESLEGSSITNPNR